MSLRAIATIVLVLTAILAPSTALATSPPSTDAQVKTLIREYGPLLMLHPLDKYKLDSPDAMLNGPSTLNWGLVNNENDPQSFSVQPLGSRETSSDTILADASIAQQDPNAADPAFRIWLESVPSLWKGHLFQARSYVRVLSPAPDTLDLQFWFFYAYNGPVKVQASFQITPTTQISPILGLQNVGRHQGDWEHVTLRFTPWGANAEWRLSKVFLAQHSGGQWLDANQLSYVGSTHHPIIYSALDSHASFAGAGTHVGQVVLTQGALQVRQVDFTRNGLPFATYWPGNYEIVSSDVPGAQTIDAPEWFSYDGLWGPYELHSDGASIGTVNLTYALVDKGPVGPAQHGPDPMP